MTQTTEWDVVVVGGANTDYQVRGSKLPQPGETVEGDEFLTAAGGKGANQAVAVARLGARVAFVAKVGMDERGEALMAQLAAEGVDTRYMVRDRTAATGVAVIQVNQQGQKQIQTAPGANRQMTVADIQAAAAALRSTQVVLTQLEVPLDCVMEAARLGHEGGAKVVLDPAPPTALSDEFIRLIDAIRPNSAEAEQLTGVRVSDRASARQAAEALFQRGVKVVAVQAGDEGNLLVWREGECWLPKIPVESVDATGAGDAFAAALAVAIAESLPLAEAGRFANAAAALATTKLGAQAGLPQREAVQALCDRLP